MPDRLAAQDAQETEYSDSRAEGFEPSLPGSFAHCFPGYSPPFDDDRLAQPGSLIDCDYGDCPVD